MPSKTTRADLLGSGFWPSMHGYMDFWDGSQSSLLGEGQHGDEVRTPGTHRFLPSAPSFGTSCRDRRSDALPGRCLNALDRGDLAHPRGQRTGLRREVAINSSAASVRASTPRTCSTRRTAPRPDAPDLERVGMMQSYWGNPATRTFGELLIDCEEDRTLWADQGSDTTPHGRCATRHRWVKRSNARWCHVFQKSAWNV